jgi:UDP-N-acetylglucosamine--N-acetylmuramyl-(pentapeptide) pyrophosphoryl-undecaprenol N-acetylglucosamine transferase
LKLVKSYKQAKQILKATNPDLLFCKGGYVSIPAAYAAHRLHIPVLTHESDMSAGIANKVIAPVCKQVLTAFPTTAQQFKRATFVGTPVRKSLFSRNRYEAKKAYGLDMRPTILVFGGGSGSQAINQNLQKALPALCQEYNVLHICGKGNLTKDAFYGYKQVEFINDMGLAYACADYAVARCGANSANELVALKIPTLFIPLANHQSRGDQIENAQYFYKQGLCHILQEKDLTPESLKKAIYRLIADRTLVHHLEESTTAVANQAIINIIATTLQPPPTSHS